MRAENRSARRTPKGIKIFARSRNEIEMHHGHERLDRHARSEGHGASKWLKYRHIRCRPRIYLPNARFTGARNSLPFFSLFFTIALLNFLWLWHLHIGISREH